MVAFTLNGRRVSVRTEPSTPLLWAVREHLKLTGTKYGCGAGLCGACTEQVPQCGYCQSGQIMKAAELLAKNPKPSRDQIVAHMNGNICRCGTYNRIVAAIQRASKEG